MSTGYSVKGNHPFQLSELSDNAKQTILLEYTSRIKEIAEKYTPLTISGPTNFLWSEFVQRVYWVEVPSNIPTDSYMALGCLSGIVMKELDHLKFVQQKSNIVESMGPSKLLSSNQIILKEVTDVKSVPNNLESTDLNKIVDILKSENISDREFLIYYEGSLRKTLEGRINVPARKNSEESDAQFRERITNFFQDFLSKLQRFADQSGREHQLRIINYLLQGCPFPISNFNEMEIWTESAKNATRSFIEPGTAYDSVEQEFLRMGSLLKKKRDELSSVNVDPKTPVQAPPSTSSVENKESTSLPNETERWNLLLKFLNYAPSKNAEPDIIEKYYGIIRGTISKWADLPLKDPKESFSEYATRSWNWILNEKSKYQKAIEGKARYVPPTDREKLAILEKLIVPSLARPNEHLLNGTIAEIRGLIGHWLNLPYFQPKDCSEDDYRNFTNTITSEIEKLREREKYKEEIPRALFSRVTSTTFFERDITIRDKIEYIQSWNLRFKAGAVQPKRNFHENDHLYFKRLVDWLKEQSI